MLKELISLANELDNKGLLKEADALDKVIQKMAESVPHHLRLPYDISLIGSSPIGADGTAQGESQATLRHYGSDTGEVIKEVNFPKGPSKEVIADVESKVTEWKNSNWHGDAGLNKWFVLWEGTPSPNLPLTAEDFGR